MLVPRIVRNKKTKLLAVVRAICGDREPARTIELNTFDFQTLECEIDLSGDNFTPTEKIHEVMSP